MNERRNGHPLDAAEQFFASPRFASALTQAIIGTEIASFFLQRLIGWPGLLGILTTLVVLAAISLLARRHALQWNGLLPISLLVFVGWAAISIFWSQYQWATFGSVVYLGAVTTLGIYIALVRDTIQIARAFGDVLRLVLVLSLALEILAGVLIDSPIHLFGIQGHLDILGPLQGIFGTRNQLGIVALIALVTFGTEFRTKSVSRGLGIGSLAIALLLLLLSRSPVALGSLLVVGLAAVALYGLRRASLESKRFWQFGLLIATIAVAGIAWAARTPIIAVFSANAEVNLRLRLWNEVRGLIPFHALEGWGWTGAWRPDIPPFNAFVGDGATAPASALSAYIDVWFQLGFVGLVILIGLVGLTFVRSWLLASKQRSFVYAWPALVLVALITTGLAESSLLVEFGWLTFVVCSVKAARELSWRRAFREELRPARLPPQE
ncbi:MAG: exopolysaccharide biosynthesis protein [Microbacteriaceae bacterium]|nr:exopolysaccharide biosynthesis protein [Microbacteriaceae bacterium]